MSKAPPFDYDSPFKDGLTYREFIEKHFTSFGGNLTYPDLVRVTGLPYTRIRYCIQRSEKPAVPRVGKPKRMISDDAPAAESPVAAPVPEDVKALRYEIARLRKENDKLAATQSIVVEAIRDAVQPIPAAPLLPPPAYKGGRHKPHILQALLGDIQFGTFIDRQDTGGLSHCSVEAFYERARAWVEAILTITEIHRNAYPVDVLEVVGLGDYVEGETIYLGQAHHIDQPVLDQVFVGSKIIADCLWELKKRGRFQTVRTRWIAGNHGMPAGKKGGTHPRSNWDYFFAHDVEARCSRLPIEFVISASNFMAWRIPEAPKHIHLATHGDQIPSSFSIPYYGVDRAVRSYAALTGLPVDYFYVAHHHRRASVDTPRGKWIMNGNWVGGSVLAVARMMTGGDANQTLTLIHPERGIVAEYPITLAEMPVMAEDAYGLGVFTPVMEPFQAIPE